MQQDQQDKDNWPKYSIFILSELERLGENDKEIIKHIMSMKLEMATLKAKSVSWGSLAGFIASFVITSIAYVYDKFST